MSENNFFEKFQDCYYFIIDNCIESTQFEKVFKLSVEGISKLNEMAALLAENSYHHDTILKKINKEIREYVNKIIYGYKYHQDIGSSPVDLLNNAGISDFWPELNDFIKEQIVEGFKTFYFQAFEFIFNLGTGYASNHNAITTEAGLRTHLAAQSENIINMFILMNINEIFVMVHRGDTVSKKIGWNLSEKMKSLDFAALMKKINRGKTASVNLWRNGNFINLAMQAYKYKKIKSRISGVINKHAEFSEIETAKDEFNKLIYDVICVLNIKNKGLNQTKALLEDVFNRNEISPFDSGTLEMIAKELINIYFQVQLEYSPKYVDDPDKLDEVKTLAYNKLIEHIIRIASGRTRSSVNLEFMKGALLLVIRNTEVVNKIMDLYRLMTEYAEKIEDGDDNGKSAGSKSVDGIIKNIMESQKEKDSSNKFAEVGLIVDLIKLKFEDFQVRTIIIKILEKINFEASKPGSYDEKGNLIKGGIGLLRGEDAKNPVNISELRRTIGENISDYELRSYTNDLFAILGYVLENEKNSNISDIIARIIKTMKNDKIK